MYGNGYFMCVNLVAASIYTNSSKTEVVMCLDSKLSIAKSELALGSD